MPSGVERLRLTRKFVRNGVPYIVDATLYRRVTPSTMGVATRTDWTVDCDTSRVDPEPAARLKAEFLAEMETAAKLKRPD